MKRIRTGEAQNVSKANSDNNVGSTAGTRTRRKTNGKFLAVLLSICLLIGVVPSALALDDGVPRDLNLCVEETSTESLTLWWDYVQDADYFEVSRSLAPFGYFSLIANVEASNYYIDEGLDPDTTYYYTVKAFSYELGELTSSMEYGKTAAATAVITVEATRTNDGPSLSWSYVGSATEYYVLRSTSETFNPTTDIIATVAAEGFYPYYIDTAAEIGTYYYYTIQADVPSSCNTVGCSKLQMTLEVHSATTSTLSMYWNAISGATQYQVFRSNSQNGTYSHVATVVSTSFVDRGLTSNTTYHYKVYAYEGSTQGIHGYANGTTLAIPSTVVFNGNGGEPASTTLSDVPAYSLIEAPLLTFTRDGYELAGWYKESDCTNQWDFASDKVGEDATLNLYAKWNKVNNTYTVSFDSTEADVAASPATATVTEPDTTLVLFPRNPSRDGYKFLGWYTEETGGERFTVSSEVTSNVTVYAQWEKLVVPPATTPTDSTPSTPGNPESPSVPEGPVTPVTDTDPDPETDEPEAPEEEQTTEDEDEEAPFSSTGAGSRSNAALAGPTLGESLSEQRLITFNQMVSDGVPTVTLGSLDVPLFGWGYENVWALLNLILALCGAFCGVMLLANLITRNKKQPADLENSEQIAQTQKQSTRKGKTSVLWTIIGMVVSIAGMVVFFATENLNTLMVVFTDNWTPLMVAIAAVVGVSTIIALRKKSPKATKDPAATAAKA